ncbi:universal stress protein [Candidatus Sumerlaeota bacterium]|nr:universal stress protein [Candidatus Sumerlaeota bacterium]
MPKSVSQNPAHPVIARSEATKQSPEQGRRLLRFARNDGLLALFLACGISFKTRSKKILHGLDGSEGSLKALAEAIDLARICGAQLHTISVEEIPRLAETVGEVIEEKEVSNHRFRAAVHQARKMAAEAGVELHSHIVVGHEVKTIAEFVSANGFDLLVLGFMGHSALYDRIMGSTCQSLVRLAPCSVLVVK